MHAIKIITIICLVILLAMNCKTDTSREVEKKVPSGPAISNVITPEWVKNAVIYEVNVRQYTPEGTFNAFTEHLPRLKTLGVDILWFMPVNPIGVKNRKGPLGSYYSVKDYTAVNPEFGTMEDFRRLVEQVHEQGMYAIIDWVPNHTAWDHRWTKEHPDWYKQDEKGEFVSPFDWTDVIQLDYDNEEMRQEMIEEMIFWIRESDIDGFRCDVAHMVPVDFWDEARKELDKVKPVFMLAESDQYFLHKNAFDMTYGWPFHQLIKDIAKGKKTANAISYHFGTIDSLFPAGSIIMQFTSNHDENSWNGTVYELFDGGVETFTVLAATVPGMPLIYSGQEAGLNKRLRFFEKDTIKWGEHELFGVYQKLLGLKHRNPALWNGKWGGSLTRVTSSDNKAVYAFVREKESDRVFVILNLTGEQVTVTLKGKVYPGRYNEVFSDETVTFRRNEEVTLTGWEYRVFEKMSSEK
jgi:glycosidase